MNIKKKVIYLSLLCLCAVLENYYLLRQRQSISIFPQKFHNLLIMEPKIPELTLEQMQARQNWTSSDKFNFQDKLIVDHQELLNYKFSQNEKLFPDLSYQVEPGVTLENFKFHTAQIVVMCLSARENFQERANILKTWAENEPNVYFMIGRFYCPWPKNLKESRYGCELSQKILEINQKFKFQEYDLKTFDPDQTKFDPDKLENHPQNFDQNEDFRTWQDAFPQIIAYRHHQDKVTYKLSVEKRVILLPMMDTYDNLSLKTKLSYRWVYEMMMHQRETKIPGRIFPKWILKIDDDAIARLQSLEKFLETEYPFNQYPHLYFGWTVPKGGALSEGKWAEKKFEYQTFPPYCNGNAGYIISIHLARFIAINAFNLPSFQNEDASVGIWLASSNYEIQMARQRPARTVTNMGYNLCLKEPIWQGEVKTQYFATNTFKKISQLLLIGHKLNIQQMNFCWEHFYGEGSENQQKNESPRISF